MLFETIRAKKRNDIFSEYDNNKSIFNKHNKF